jgi:GntR family transcriptional regulator
MGQMILKIDIAGHTPIYQQIRNQIMAGVAKGDLKPGDKLPTVRQLAGDIGVNPMTVNKAYALLKKEGIIIADRRHGAQIRDNSEMKNKAFDKEFDYQAQLLISQAHIKGASKQDIKKHLSDMIDRICD